MAHSEEDRITRSPIRQPASGQIDREFQKREDHFRSHPITLWMTQHKGGVECRIVAAMDWQDSRLDSVPSSGIRAASSINRKHRRCGRAYRFRTESIAIGVPFTDGWEKWNCSTGGRSRFAGRRRSYVDLACATKSDKRFRSDRKSCE